MLDWKIRTDLIKKTGNGAACGIHRKAVSPKTGDFVASSRFGLPLQALAAGLV